MIAAEPQATSPQPSVAASPMTKRARLGFLGVGWIGRHRLEALARSKAVEVVAIADTAIELAATAAAAVAPAAVVCDSFESLLPVGLDGVVIATPSALHAEQALIALQNEIAVFCQKPLGRNAAETRSVVETARKADRLLGVDLSYRFVDGVQQLHNLCQSGALGRIYAAELTFHNAYGPDKGWFYDRRLSGGGCLMDLGTHLVDLALWNLGFPALTGVSGRLFAQGEPLTDAEGPVEDYAEARLDLAGGATVRLACSWKLPAGREAVIRGAFYGSKGGAAFENLDGSLSRFRAERFLGTRSELLGELDESWGGCAALDWARRLARGERFAAEAEHFCRVAETLDSIYAQAGDFGREHQP